MTGDDIRNTLSRLQHLMHGFNYEVTFGIDIFGDCPTLEDFNKKLKQQHKDIQPNKTQPILFEERDFWEEIDFGLNFRGDSAAGLSLSLEKGKELEIEQTKYIKFIQQFISDRTIIYSYPDEEGVPVYVVYWGYAFILINIDRPSLFIYGAASD